MIEYGYNKEIISDLDNKIFNRFRQIGSSGRDSKALVRIDIKLGRLNYSRYLDMIYLKNMC